MKYEAVIFDLDGTLIHSLEDLADAMNIVLKEKGFPEHDLKSYQYFIGNGIKALVKKALPDKYRDKATINKCFLAMKHEYEKISTSKTHLYKGISELLDELIARNLKMAILSNKANDLTQEIAKTLLNKWSFSVIMGSLNGIPRKPNPMGANLICQRLNINPSNILYVGDTGIDMKTAKAAGMFAVGVLWGYRNSEELLENGADVLIEHPLELIEYLI